jgi:hypothetical protein
MTDAAIVFLAQFVQVLLLGLQSQTVAHGYKAAAACNSLALGTIGYYITATIAANRGDFGGSVWWAFVVAGPCGIVTSMILFRRFRKCV